MQSVPPSGVQRFLFASTPSREPPAIFTYPVKYSRNLPKIAFVHLLYTLKLPMVYSKLL